MADERLRHRAYTREHGDDPPDVTDWRWPAEQPAPAAPAAPERVRVLVVNAGSSSLKLRCSTSDDRDRSPRASWTRPARSVDPRELAEALDSRLGEADAVGHRIVHGGERFRGASDRRRRRARRCGELVELAPLHQPKSLAALDAGQRGAAGRCPRSPASTPPSTRRCRPRPPPTRCRRSGASAGALRRYGFHGLSHAWVARRAPRAARRATARGPADRQLPPRRRAPRCARSRTGARVDTTMGFTPLEGLVMATRWAASTRAAAVAARARAPLRGASWPTRSSTARDCSGWRAARTCARCSRAPGSGDAAARSRSMSTSTACGPASRRWRRRSAASTRSCSPAASASTRRAVRAHAAGRAGFLGVALDARAQPAVRRATARSAPTAPPGARSCCARARTLEIARQVRALLGAG